MSNYIIIWDKCKGTDSVWKRYLAFTPVNNLMMGYDDTIQAIINVVAVYRQSTRVDIVQATELFG